MNSIIKRQWQRTKKHHTRDQSDHSWLQKSGSNSLSNGKEQMNIWKENNVEYLTPLKENPAVLIPFQGLFVSSLIHLCNNGIPMLSWSSWNLSAPSAACLNHSQLQQLPQTSKQAWIKLFSTVYKHVYKQTAYKSCNKESETISSHKKSRIYCCHILHKQSHKALQERERCKNYMKISKIIHLTGGGWIKDRFAFKQLANY